MHLISLLALSFLALGGCRNVQDIGQGYLARGFSAPWDGKTSDVRFCCHSTAERFFFSFEVMDSTVTLTEPFVDERDVEPEDRVEIFFSPDRELKKGYHCAEIDPHGRIMDYSARYYRDFDYGWNFSTMEAEGAVLPWGYRVRGSVSRQELEELGIDLEKGFWMGAYMADFCQDGSVIWYSLVPDDVPSPDFHVPGVMFECRATPKAEKRGVVVYPDDITSVGPDEWKRRIDLAGINLIGLHAATSNDPIDTLEAFVKSGAGQDFLSLCAAAGVDVEYELHALECLLPRGLYQEHPEYFRMDENGNRCPDYNMCFSCEEAYEAMRPQIETLLEWVRPTTQRYYFWTDDKVGKFCHCERCAAFSPAEQALIYENRLLSLIREYDPEATLAHLAYQQTLSAPVNVRAEDGVFLEYAPIKRDYRYPLTEEQTAALRANTMAFPAHSQHILEYWLDESMFSRWKKGQPVPLPFETSQASRDIDCYRRHGAADVTCFATWLNGLYISRFGSTDDIFRGYGESYSAGEYSKTR